MRHVFFNPPSTHVWLWRVGGWFTMLGGLLITAQGLFVGAMILAGMVATTRGEFDELGRYFGGIAAVILLGVGVPLFLAGWLRSWGAFVILVPATLVGAYMLFFFFGGPHKLDPGATAFFLLVCGGPLLLGWAGALAYSFARIAAAGAGR